MGKYVVRRLLQAVPLLLVISFVAFAIVQATGDPLSAYTVEAALTSEDIERLRAHYGLDQPMVIQYFYWLRNLLTGDWGTSYHFRQPVLNLVLGRLPNTLVLVVIAYSIVLVSSIILGVLTAVRQYSIFDHIVTGLSFIGIATPSFWLGLMLIIVFAVQFRNAGLPYVPTGGMYDPRVGTSVPQVLWHAILPSFTLAFVITARYIRYIRSSILEQLHLDYVRTARSKGLGERLVLFRHVFRNALLPLITLGALDIPILLSGTIVIEAIFNWPGMGRLFWASAERADMPVLMAIMVLVAALTVVCNLVADILYGVVDPRIKY
jgi:peptide/nickel transport system permease protein